MYAVSCFANPPYQWRPVMWPDPDWPNWEDPDEPLGSKDKEWVIGPEEPDGRNKWLFKYARLDSGEYWAECVVHALACLIGVPTACVQPASKGGRDGILSRSMLHDGELLTHGSELLTVVLNGRYDPHRGDDNPDYTVANVQRSLHGVEPPNRSLPGFTAFDTWAGYLVLDAWVSGTDRHHDNWAVAIDRAGHRRLAESFDRGSALGFSLSEGAVCDLSGSGSVRSWVERGRTHFAGNPSMVDALQALNLASNGVKDYWLSRLGDVRFDDVMATTSGLPESTMSDQRRAVVLDILTNNQERILNDRSG